MVGWSRFNPKKLEKNQRLLLEVSGVDLEVERVLIDDGLFLYTLVTNEPEKPLLIMLHGYGGSGLCFYGLIKELSHHFNIVAVDLLGMGRSSRPKYHPQGPEESESFFVDSLEKMRSIKNYESFVLLGHSFGGYIAGCYYLQFPQYIRSLMFLSPVGVNIMPDQHFEKRIQNASWKLKLALKFAQYAWKKHISPFSVMRKVGPFSKKLVKSYTRRKLTGIAPQELKHLEKYLEQICLLPGSGEYALTHILKPGAWAVNPLCERLDCLEIPTLFLYGENDWMNPAGALHLKDNFGLPIDIEIIKDAGHQLFWDNPTEVAREILGFTHKTLGNIN